MSSGSAVVLFLVSHTFFLATISGVDDETVILFLLESLSSLMKEEAPPWSEEEEKAAKAAAPSLADLRFPLAGEAGGGWTVSW